jgi:hypothetical protein
MRRGELPKNIQFPQQRTSRAVKYELTAHLIEGSAALAEQA